MTSDASGWIGVLVSSSACIVGASIVYIDKFYNKPLLDNRSFTSASMALASGVLLFSSLSILLPEAQKRLENDKLLYTCYFIGAMFTVLLTRTIHHIMPDAIHACGESTDHHHDHYEEDTKLNKHHYDVEYGTIRSSPSHFKLPHDNDQQFNDDEDTVSIHSHHTLEAKQIDKNSYYNIGIQTAVAICVHKFPEGLVMFISSKASTTLGLSVCAAMSIHNITEGFMIALPLYYATRSRCTAFLSAALMGGFSQPLGALLGLFLLKNISKTSENLLFGIIFASVSGMMSLITIQSMLPQAIRTESHKQDSYLYFFLGIFLVGLSSVLEVS